MRAALACLALLGCSEPAAQVRIRPQHDLPDAGVSTYVCSYNGEEAMFLTYRDGRVEGPFPTGSCAAGQSQPRKAGPAD